MDPHAHQLSTMDPKLKAAYESVMKGPAQPGGAASAEETKTMPGPGLGSQQTVPTIPTTPTQQPKMVTEVQKEPETVQKPLEDQHAVFTSAVKPSSGGTVHIGYSAKPGHKITLEKKKLGIPPALYIVGCVLFFMLYSLFWVKVFGVKVPFMP